MLTCFAGCAGIPKASIEGRDAFYRNDYSASLNKFRQFDEQYDKNYVLHQLNIGSAALTAGDYYDAQRALLAAGDVMSSTDSDKTRGVLSLISAESIKVFKGEPFEKAMAFFYIGIFFYNQADYENAGAAFRKALLMDKQAAEGYREDLHLVYYLLAKTYWQLGQKDNARLALNKANDRLPDSSYPRNPYYTQENLERANATFIVELGAAPVKFRHGPGASLDDFRRANYPEHQVLIGTGDRQWSAVKALDLLYEAKHRGSSGKDAVQATKGVTREAAVATAIIASGRKNKTANAVALGAGVFALLNQSQADIRQWDLLPGELHVFSGRLPAGVTTVSLQFRGMGGQLLPLYDQVWYYLPIDKDREHIYLFRSGLGKGNGAFLN